MIETKEKQKTKWDTLNSSYWSKIWIKRDHPEWVSPTYFPIFSYSKQVGHDEANDPVDCLKSHIHFLYKKFVYKSDKVIISLHTMKGVLNIDFITRIEHPKWFIELNNENNRWVENIFKNRVCKARWDEVADFIIKCKKISDDAGTDRIAANILFDALLPAKSLNQLTQDDWLIVDKHAGFTIEKLHNYIVKLNSKGFNNIDCEKFYREYIKMFNPK